MNPAEYVHQELNQEIEAIGGYYVLVQEGWIPFEGRAILYLIGQAAFETTCCGTGGCAYALVPGFVVAWKHRTNQDGLAISQVEPITDGDLKLRLQRALMDREPVHQVLFL
jgi:hypothetical protein